jgi:N-sulfoglucosamine sulfohydrolase
LPTLFDIVGIDHPQAIDGRSFEPLLRGEAQEGRDFIVKQYNENSGGTRNPMRAVQTREFLYIFSPWSNGQRTMATATKGTSTYRRMTRLAASDPKVAERLDLFDHRVVEELYNVEEDPDCLDNLIDDPVHANDLTKLQKTLDTWMEQTEDPMLLVYRERGDPEARESYMRFVEKEASKRAPKAKQQRRNLRRRAAELDANRLRRADRRSRVDEPAGVGVDAKD